MMIPETAKPFDARAFTVLGAALSGLGLPLTGLLNHLHQLESITPPRHAWMAAHNILALLFVFFTVWHLLLNRRALLKYLRSIVSRRPFIRREALWAFGLVAVLLSFAVGHAFLAQG
jgi:hypothetical protein